MLMAWTRHCTVVFISVTLELVAAEVDGHHGVVSNTKPVPGLDDIRGIPIGRLQPCGAAATLK